MKTAAFLMGVATLCCIGFAQAEDTDSKQVVNKAAAPVNPPPMSELPKMKAEGERIAALMEKLAKETDPQERRRIMAEVTCPQ
jgi:hypothetical protein